MEKTFTERILKDEEIDWTSELAVYALNLSTMQFENTSYLTKDSEIVLTHFWISNPADYSEDIADLAKSHYADYLLYNDSLFCVGYVNVK